MHAILKNRVVVTNVVYAVALAVSVALLSRSGVNHMSLASMLGTGAAVFGLFDIALAVLYGTGYSSVKEMLRGQGILIALLVWQLLFAVVMLLSTVMTDPEALMGLAVLISSTAFIVIAIGSNNIIDYAAPKVLEK